MRARRKEICSGCSSLAAGAALSPRSAQEAAGCWAACPGPPCKRRGSPRPTAAVCLAAVRPLVTNWDVARVRTRSAGCAVACAPVCARSRSGQTRRLVRGEHASRRGGAGCGPNHGHAVCFVLIETLRLLMRGHACTKKTSMQGRVSEPQLDLLAIRSTAKSSDQNCLGAAACLVCVIVRQTANEMCRIKLHGLGGSAHGW